MKTYILRDPKSVEPQNPRGLVTRATADAPTGRPEPPAPARAAPVERGRAAPRGPALYVGLDVHTESIAVSLAPSDATEVRRYGMIGGTHDDVLKLAKKLQAAHPGVPLRFVYEAGPHGYPLCRCLRAHGYDCQIVAPSKIPRAPLLAARAAERLSTRAALRVAGRDGASEVGADSGAAGLAGAGARAPCPCHRQSVRPAGR